jgi:hypothetical protein
MIVNGTLTSLQRCLHASHISTDHLNAHCVLGAFTNLARVAAVIVGATGERSRFMRSVNHLVRDRRVDKVCNHLP